MKLRKFSKSQVGKIYNAKSLYEALKMTELFKSEEIVQTSQMRMNRYTLSKLDAIMKDNWKKYPNSKELGESNVRKLQAKEVIQFFPKLDNDTPNWHIGWLSVEEFANEYREELRKKKENECKSTLLTE